MNIEKKTAWNKKLEKYEGKFLLDSENPAQEYDDEQGYMICEDGKIIFRNCRPWRSNNRAILPTYRNWWSNNQKHGLLAGLEKKYSK